MTRSDVFAIGCAFVSLAVVLYLRFRLKGVLKTIVHDEFHALIEEVEEMREADEAPEREAIEQRRHPHSIRQRVRLIGSLSRCGEVIGVGANGGWRTMVRWDGEEDDPRWIESWKVEVLPEDES